MRKLAILIFLTLVCTAGLIAGGTTYAASDISLDNTNIITDLSDFEINAQEVNINDYEFNDNKSLDVINFAEFGYAYRVNQQNNYNLYIYFYNPKNLDISKNSIMNKLQMSVNGNDYNKYSLRYCSDLNNLIYKYRVIDVDNTILDLINDDVSAPRVYKVSGIELLINDDVSAREYDIGKTFEYSGFAGGYGEDLESASSLALNVTELETIILDVEQTNYRTATSDKGAGYQNEINTAYFSVPNNILDQYGALQKIMAEWWEYKTAPVIVTNNNDLYNDFNDYIAVSSLSESVPDNYKLYSGLNVGINQDDYQWAWNITPGMYAGKVITVQESIDKFYYLFNSTAANIEDAEITKEDLKDYIYSYNQSYDNGTLPIKDNTISADLFADSVEEGRTMGYNIADIDAGDEFDLLSYGESHNFWQTFLDFGFLAPELGEDIEGISPIYQVKASDLLNTNSNVSSNLLINQDDITEFKNYCQAEALDNKSVFLFRYAVTDYYTQGVNAVSDSGGIFGEAYRAEQSIFFDFDIIQLTFNKNDVYSVLPVVSSPQDVINATTPPQEEAAWIGDALGDWFNDLTEGWADTFKKIAMIVAAVLLLLLLWPVLPYIIKLIAFIVLLPYRIIKWIIKSIKKAVNKSKAD